MVLWDMLQMSSEIILLPFLYTHKCACTHTHTHTHTHSDTVSRCGVFCSFINATECCKTEGIVDVFQVVKGLRIQKPGSVLTVVSMSLACGKYCTVDYNLSLGLFQRALCPLGALMCPLGLPPKPTMWRFSPTQNTAT